MKKDLTNAYVNAADFVNKGFEFDLNASRLVNLGEVKFNFKVNATYNTSKVGSLYAGLPELFIGGYTNAANYAVEGLPAFVLNGTDYVRDPEGSVVVDAVTGLPTQNPNSNILGLTMPIWILGLNPSFGCKCMVSLLFL